MKEPNVYAGQDQQNGFDTERPGCVRLHRFGKKQEGSAGEHRHKSKNGVWLKLTNDIRDSPVSHHHIHQAEVYPYDRSERSAESQDVDGLDNRKRVGHLTEPNAEWQ